VVILIRSARVWALKKNRLHATFLILASRSMVIIQALLGLWTLQHNLPPVAVASHLIMEFAILLHADGPELNGRDSKIFPVPEFNPAFGILRLQRRNADVAAPIDIRQPNGGKTSGLSTPCIFQARRPSPSFEFR
jgi:hypothetical protein